jgi:hypothetical protein
MQNAADGGIAIESKARSEARNEGRNDAYHSLVSDLASLIDHVRATLALIEQAIAREISVCSQETSANVIVLDDVTPPYMKATAALRACDAKLAIVFHSLLDSNGSPHRKSGHADNVPALSIVGA